MRNRYQLERYSGVSSRFECPNCHKKGSFVRYIDSQTGQRLSSYVGRCNRLDNCGYHYPPRTFFQNDGKRYKLTSNNVPSFKPLKETLCIPSETVKNYFRDDLITANHLKQFLVSIFPESGVESIFQRYLVGASDLRQGSTVFFQIDLEGRVRAGKIIQYDPATGKRIKNNPPVSWVHNAENLKTEDNELRQCLFGLHLLKESPSHQPIGIVESEKTALIATIKRPDQIWLATGSQQNVSERMFRPLRGRQLAFYPDSGCEDDWQRRIKDIQKQLTLDARLVPLVDVAKGQDLADIIIEEAYTELHKNKFLSR